MIAPPPMPNSPASTPTRAPPAIISATSQAISLSGIPSKTFSGSSGAGSGRGFGEMVAALPQLGKRVEEHADARTGLDGFGGEVPAEGTSARDGAKQAEHVAGDRVQAHALRDFALNVRHHRQRRVGWG